MTDEQIGKLIKKKRTSLDTSKYKLGKQTKITFETISSIEKGKIGNIKVLRNICDALNLEIIVKEKESNEII